MAPNGFDFISSMPDPVLELILQGLPYTEEVVRTSILSTRWRYLWTSIPHFPSLNFDCDRLLNPPGNEFQQFVSWALANKTVDLDSLRLCCASYHNISTLDTWIQAAIMRKVKKLDLMICRRCNFDEITMSFMPYDSVEVLRLFLYNRALRVSYPMWRALKVLELNHVHCFYADLVQLIIIYCPLLEELNMIECSTSLMDQPAYISSPRLKTLIIRNWEKNYMYGYKHFSFGVVLSCPELVLFEYVGPRGPLRLNSLDNLKKVVILPADNLTHKISYEKGVEICELFAQMSHVESMSLNLYFIQCVHAARDEKGKLSFPNLKTLEVTTTIDAFTLKVLIQILRCSPNLESIHCVIQKEHLRTKYWRFDEVATRNILTRHLKTVKFLGFKGKKQKLGIARFLLEDGNALEEMVFSWSSKVKYNEKSMKMMNKLSKLCMASSTVKLISLLDE